MNGLILVPTSLLYGLFMGVVGLTAVLMLLLILAKPVFAFVKAKLFKRPTLIIVRPDRSVDFKTAKREGDSYIVKPYGRFTATPSTSYVNPQIGVIGFALSTRRSLVNAQTAKFLEKTKGRIDKNFGETVAGETLDFGEIEKYLEETGSPAAIENLVKLVEARTAMEYLRSLPKGGGFNWWIIFILIIIRVAPTKHCVLI